MVCSSDFNTPLIDRIAFQSEHAALVASWIDSDDVLHLVSPETKPPVTADKVAVWSRRDTRPFLFRDVARDSFIGYGELNDMPCTPQQKWIGHLVLAPGLRGTGLGFACVGSLLSLAFDELSSPLVLLVVVPENSAAVRCYERWGFVNSGDEWKQSHDGSRRRLIRMRLSAEDYLGR